MGARKSLSIIFPAMKPSLFGQTLPELAQTAAAVSLPSFACRQIARWMYKRGVADPLAMTDISLAGRQRLADGFESGLSAPVAQSVSTDGTKKYLFGTSQGKFIESAYIPDGERATLCVSSQAGCRMGCRFCMTAKQGFQHNLSAGEILNQAVSIPEADRLTNIVYMGMGEPLDNVDEVLRSLEIITSDWGWGWSPTRVTVSTAGVAPVLDRFLSSTSVHLAVSLHNPFPEQRAQIMPIEKAYPIKEVLGIIRRHDFSHQRRVSFEYILLRGINDTPAHVNELARLLNGLSCRINLIRFHEIPDSEFVSGDMASVIAFRDALSRKGIITTIRSSRGQDIDAACGLLSTKKLLEGRNK